jgi:hypothetical protein
LVEAKVKGGIAKENESGKTGTVLRQNVKHPRRLSVAMMQGWLLCCCKKLTDLGDMMIQKQCLDHHVA